jgi:GMP synthase-like glutamine amidotransferase
MLGSMSGAVILQQVPFESPGRIVPVFRDFGIPCEVRHLYRGDEVPSDLDELRVLVVLGGPMGVNDIGSAAYPFLAKEVELLKRLIAIDRPVLGICLGAQLLAHAAGAKVYPLTPAPEIGWAPVAFPFPGGTEPIVFGLNEGAQMFHWHFDTFDLPKLPASANPAPPPAPPPPTGSALISSTRACKNQAFRFKARLFGFQYHFEMTPDGIDALLANRKEDAQKVLGPQGEQKIKEDTAKYYPRYARLGDRIIENFVQFLKAYEPLR